ncbi:docking protein 1 isoform X2 [Aythya fuligula]|uniref:Docking protein 1 isoform X2 n=1 Tax=Aythya fuligula TaxID=219594 RepID=A0A6J3CWW3_AYTFU|nr:docking protein 1 isoform X2 [Aythya fuligula]
MEPPAKEGPLFVQHSHKFGTKRWKRGWFALFPASQHGVARLEFFDCKEPAGPPGRLGTRRLDKTVVRLADCTSVAPAPAESGPRAGTVAFRLETSGRSYLLAADKQQSEEWVAKLCEIAFPVMFSFEAGRRCDSGPGNFTFETKQGNEIFRLVEDSIREQKAQVEENRQSCDSLDSDSPSVVLIRQALADSLSLELPVEGDDTAAPKAGLAPRSIAAVEERDTVSLLKNRTLPEPPVLQAKPTVPSTPPRSPLPKAPRAALLAEDPSSLYSEPLDSVKGFRPWLDPLYSDPVDSKAASGAPDEAKLRVPAPLYTGAYEQVRAEARSQEPGRKEHIYDEPEGRAPRAVPSAACIYDEARPTGEAWRTQGHDGKGGYEYPYNPSTDDYSVPAFQAKAKGPKPVPAPKPPAAFIPKGVERSGDPGKRRGNPASEKAVIKPSLNSSSNNNNKVEVLYSQVVKPQQGQKKEQSVDECSLSPVYEDLGEI